jgi:Ser-tRNA(Ala) deacylase AlaX
MKTATLYYEQPYTTEMQAKVLSVEPKAGNTLIELDRTIFYPEGGGQPSDQGEIVGANGRLKVEFVQYKDGRILHQGKLQGTISSGEQVNLNLKWRVRYHNMRVHSAGHLVHDVLMTMVDNLKPLKGNHGKKAFLEYSGEFDSGQRELLEQNVNKVVSSDIPISMSENTYEEISAKCKFVPSGLPKNKPLRTLQIGLYDPMPDGGVHVKSTGEIGQVIIQDIVVTDGNTTIRYRIAGGEN